MKQLLLILFLGSFISCTEKKWDKDTAVNSCLRDFNKKNEVEKKFSGMEIPLLCDCIAEKMVSKYKSEKQASKDEEGMMKIGSDCSNEVFKK